MVPSASGGVAAASPQCDVAHFSDLRAARSGSAVLTPAVAIPRSHVERPARRQADAVRGRDDDAAPVAARIDERQIARRAAVVAPRLPAEDESAHAPDA